MFKGKRALRRSGLTLLEVIVVVAIILVLMALVIPAVQRAREAALRAKSQNNLKQIALGMHNFASAHLGRLPVFNANVRSVSWDPPFWALLPYVERGDVLAWTAANPLEYAPQVSLYLSPADPSVSGQDFHFPVTSYAGNAQVLHGDPRLSVTFLDGTSFTMLFAEHYAYCGKATFLYPRDINSSPAVRVASFADGGPIPNYQVAEDVYPVTSLGPPIVTVGSEPDLTFQTAPSLRDCNSRIPQSPHVGGMLIAMADGSVHTLRQNIKPTVFWALVTPSAGDTSENDW